MSHLHRYIIRYLLTGFGLVAAVLLALMGLFDLAEQLEEVGSGNYQFNDAIRHAALKLPGRFVDMTPFIGLLGGLIGLGLLSQHHELTAMAAAGLRPAALVRATLTGSLVLVSAQGAAVVWLAPAAEQSFIREERTLTNEGLGDDSAFWSRDGDRILRIAGLRHGRLPQDLELFELDGTNRLRRYIHARQVSLQPDDSWRLEDVVIKRFKGGQRDHEERVTLDWEPFLDAQQLTTLQLPADSLTPSQLYRYTRHLEGVQREADRYRLMLWRKPGMILMTIAMTLLALPFATRATPRSSPAPYLVAGALVGLGIYLADELLVRLGSRLDLPLPLVTMAPAGALTVVVIGIMFRDAPPGP